MPRTFPGAGGGSGRAMFAQIGRPAAMLSSRLARTGPGSSPNEIPMPSVKVETETFEFALRRFKRTCEGRRAGETCKREFYEKPTGERKAQGRRRGEAPGPPHLARRHQASAKVLPAPVLKPVAAKAGTRERKPIGSLFSRFWTTGPSHHQTRASDGATHEPQATQLTDDMKTAMKAGEGSPATIRPDQRRDQAEGSRRARRDGPIRWCWPCWKDGQAAQRTRSVRSKPPTTNRPWSNATNGVIDTYLPAKMGRADLGRDQTTPSPRPTRATPPADMERS